MRRTMRVLPAIAAAFVLAVAAAPLQPLYAEGITRVRGTIKDIHGNPVTKVKVWFEASDIKKRVGPLTTSKDGVFVIAALDVSVAKKWKVVPELQGYKTVKVHY